LKLRLFKFGVPLVLGIAVLVYGMLHRMEHPTVPASPPPEIVASVHTAEVNPPISVRELLHNLSEHSGPIRSGSFKGYTRLQSTEPLRLKLNWDSTNLRLEWHGRGGENVWQAKDLGVFQFKEDPASLVLRLPDNSILFLKYEAAKSLTAYPQSLQVFTGWHVDKRNASKIVMIEDVQNGWPRADSLKEIWPEDLPY
jgi:hypothetical protein